MKTTAKTKLLSILAAALIATVPMSAMTMTAYAAQTTTLPANVKIVTETGDLEVSIPAKVSDSFEVKAYEMLQLVINKDAVWTAGTAMTNAADSQNLYVVTDNFKAFFSAAKAAYTAEESTLPAENTLYLSYNLTDNALVLSKTKPEGTEKKDYIVIDNTAHSTGHKGKLEKEFFEADLVSRIITVTPDRPESDASDARLLSDWASRYIRAKGFAADQTAAKEGTPVKFKFSGLIYGYYAVVTNDDATDDDKSVINQSILNVPMATNVTLKATPVTIDKSVDNLVDANKNNNAEEVKKNTANAKVDEDEENGTKYDKITANIGDILEYKVESHIPAYTSYNFADATKLLDQDVALDAENFSEKISGKYVYTFRDTMINQDFIAADATVSGVAVDGLKVEIYNAAGNAVEKTFVVKKVGTAFYLVDKDNNNAAAADAVARLWETDYTETAKTNFFAINFNIVKLKTLGLDARDVLITYHAELRGEANNSTTENDAKFTYSNDPFDASTNDTIEDKNKVYTYDLKVDKVFSDGATDLFDKVTFKLFSDEAKEKSIQFTGTAGVFVRADSNDSTKTDVLTLTADGKLKLHGLGEGTYYLVEQNNTELTSKGYNTVNPIKVVITAKNNADIIDTDALTLFNAENKASSTAMVDEVYLTIQKMDTTNAYGIEFEVLNQKGFTLPLTGEFGNWMLAIAGIVLVAVGGTVIVLANKKKKVKATTDEN